MSEEFVSGCIQHRDTRHLRLYYDYMDIYSDNEYKAKIIRILETWTDHKRTEWYKTNSDRLEQGQEVLEPDFWITMSYQQFRQFMRHTASEDILKKAFVELESSKHIKRRINPDFPYGPPQYLLNAKVIQVALNKLTVPPQVPDLPPQEDTPPPGKTIPPQEITPWQGVELPPPRGEETRGGGGKNTPTLGGKFGTSNITTKNYLEDVIDSDKEESTGGQSDTTTSAPSLSLDAAPSSSPQSGTHAHCFFCQEEAELTCRVCGKGVCYDTHGRRFPLTETDIEDYCLSCLEAHNAASTTQAEAAPEIDEEWCNAETEHRLPAIPKTSPLPPAVEPGRSGGPTPVAPATYHIAQVGDMTELDEQVSHEQNRDASPGNVAVEVDLGVASSVPIPPVPPEVSPPRTMRATVVSPETGGKPKRSRTKDEPTKQQIDTVYVVFDELYQAVLEDPEFTCPHTPTSTTAIKELIKRKAS